jgi:hypothetical protein
MFPLLADPFVSLWRVVVELPANFLSNVLMALAISLIVSFIVMTMQGWLRRLRGCGGLLTFVTVIGILLVASYLLHTRQL